MTVALKVDEVQSGYGEMVVLNGISLTVHENEIVAVIGPNGAGKTTMLKVLCGLLPKWKGKIQLWGSEVANEPAHRRVKRGIGYVPEGARVFGELTVFENLEMGAYNRNDRAVMRDLEFVLNLFPELKGRLKTKAKQLSGGQRQMLAIGRGLMSRPKLLMLDEPSLGLAPLVVREVFEKLLSIRDSGTAILIVEQNVNKALQVADRGYVISGGKIVAHGKAQELRADPTVSAAYLGF